MGLHEFVEILTRKPRVDLYSNGCSKAGRHYGRRECEINLQNSCVFKNNFYYEMEEKENQYVN